MCAAVTSSPSLVPLPSVVQETGGTFTLTEETVVAADEALADSVLRLQEMLRPATGLALRWVSHTAGPAIRLELDPALAAEGYVLDVDTDGIRLVAGSPAGLFYGGQVLRQLLPAPIFRRSRVRGCAWSVPGVHVADAPRYGWRGLMLDVARHFLPKQDVLRLIDLLAAHRLNVLHLHLTDDQGWRIQIRRYPRLTEVGSWRRSSQIGEGDDAPQDGRPHGGFYTQDDIREIVGYARERFVTVVPEVDTPGHAQAVLAAYPELGVTGRTRETSTRWGMSEDVLNIEESTLRFATDVLDEVMELFDSEFIGIGGDECPKTQWHDDPRTQQRMRELGVADEDALQSWFVSRLEAHVSAAGRRIFGWDEILEGELTPGATIASWRGTAGAVGAAGAGHDVVSCPDDQVYFDYRQSDRPDEPIPVSVVVGLADVYSFEPAPSGLDDAQAAHILGGQANVWTEHMDSARVVDYYVFPRLCALAEALWSHRKDWDGFLARMAGHQARLDALGVEYRHAEGPSPWQTRPDVAGRPETRQEPGSSGDGVSAALGARSADDRA